MTKNGVFKSLALAAVITVSGCASIPQESVTLNKEVATGITSIHESNIRFVNQYFDIKSSKIDKYEKEALDNYFNKIAAATTKPGAPPLGVQDLYKIKEKVEEIHAVGTKFKAELNASKDMIIEKLQGEYNLILSANSSITGLLQSAVDIDKAKNDGLSKVKAFTDGKIDLTDIDSKVNEYLSKFGSSSAQASSLIESIQETLNSGKGDD
jgi:hypothetical protein